MTMFIYHEDGTSPENSDTIFVFGSNLAGIHGAGAAHAAYIYHGAEMGVGVGFYGNSYAIPTKNYEIETLPLPVVKAFIRQFVHVTNKLQYNSFFITRIGCGLAGFKDSEIAPLFKGCCKNNTTMPLPWQKYLE